MGPPERLKVAKMYSLTFCLWVIVGVFVQSSGRWSSLNVGNIILFASLSVGYAYFAFLRLEAFLRGEAAPEPTGQPSLCQGASVGSRIIDALVVMHCVCALAFASVMLFEPALFGLFTMTGDVPPYAMDVIRLGCPFVYGFGILAGLSLTMGPSERVAVAYMY